MTDNFEVEMLLRPEPPFVHFCEEVAEPSLPDAVRPFLADHRLVEIDGNLVPDEEALVGVCNKILGIALGHGPPHSSELHWMRFRDLIRTDVKFEGQMGCVIFVRNAENCLRSAKDGLVRLGDALAAAGAAYAKPDDRGLSQDYTPQPKSFHTVFLYGRIPRRTPVAASIKLPI